MFWVKFLLFIASFITPNISAEIAISTEKNPPQKTSHDKKSPYFFEQLHQNILKAAQKNNTQFYKAATYGCIREFILELEEKRSSNKYWRHSLTVLDTYLKKLATTKACYLGATTPQVIQLTNTALRAFERINQASKPGQEIDKRPGNLIDIIKNAYLPEYPLNSPRIFNPARTKFSAEILKDRTTHHKVDSFDIEIITPLRRQHQGYYTCVAHASANLVTFATSIRSNPAFTDLSFDKKKSFLFSLPFKTNADIKGELKKIGLEYERTGASHKEIAQIVSAEVQDIGQRYERSSYLTYLDQLEEDLDYTLCDKCKRKVFAQNKGFFYSINLPWFKWISFDDGLVSQKDSLAAQRNALLEAKSLVIKPIIDSIMQNKSSPSTTHLPTSVFLRNFLACNYENPCCPNKNYGDLIPEIIAFNKGLPVIMMTAIECEKGIQHLTANVFLKNQNNTGACIINEELARENQHNFHSRRYCNPALIEICALFLKYGNLCEFLEKTSGQIQHFLQETQKPK